MIDVDAFFFDSEAAFGVAVAVAFGSLLFLEYPIPLDYGILLLLFIVVYCCCC